MVAETEAEAEAGSGFGEDHGVFCTAPLKADRRRLTQADCRRKEKLEMAKRPPLAARSSRLWRPVWLMRTSLLAGRMMRET